ncbi:MAG: ABC transporter ATP-binding protein [Clostridia bacterium]|nr:ABC transporter ATP-binding protein [Clostridia bacterium]
MKQEKATKKKRNALDPSQDYPGFFRIITSYLAQYKLAVAIAVLGAILTGVGIAVMPHFIKYIIDDCVTPALAAGVSDAEKAAYMKMAIFLCLAYIGTAVGRQITWRIGLFFMLKALEGVIFKIRSGFFNHVQHMCMRFYDKSSSGELFNCIMGSPMANIKGFLNQIVMNVPYQLVSFIISLVALLFYDWLLTVILLVIAAAMCFVNRLTRRKIRRMTKAYLDAEAQASKYINDMLHGMDAIKMYAIEDTTISTFDRHLIEMKDKGVRQTFSISYATMKSELVQFIGTAVIYAVGAFSCIYRGVSVGTLYAFLSCMGIILTTMNGWLNMLLNYQSADVGMRKIYDVLKENTTTPDKEEGRAHNIDIERESAKRTDKPCIAFENVSFAYDKRDIFHEFNCHIGFGESVALVGGSGSGKSTLTKLILRLYEVSEGQVKLYGRDVRDYHTHDLRRSFGVVPQAPFIFYGTIWDNIRIARPDASNYDIIQAMEIAHVHEFVNDLPMGWSTLIGDGALSLSGGQKQRIAIARAVLKNPDILIFDEATSALDNLSERHIQASMEELMKTHTVIIVAHRLSTIRNVDRILVFDHGTIVEEGTYDELASKNGAFRELLDGTEPESELTEEQKAAAKK